MDTARDVCDVVLVEADGAREKPLKAPAENEPVWPSGKQLVVGVTGWDGLNSPAGEKTIHRWPLFQALTGQEPNKPVSAQSLLKLLNSSKGLFARVPHGTRCCWLINKLENCQDLREADILSRRILARCRQIDRSILAALGRKDHTINVLYSDV